MGFLEIFIPLFSSDLKRRILFLLFCCLFAVYSFCTVISITWLVIVDLIKMICCYLVILLWNMVALPRIVKVIVAPTNIQARSHLDPRGIAMISMVRLSKVPFSPLGVTGHPKNCIPPESKREEYVRMFLGELLQVIVVDTNHYARAKFGARESAFHDINHRAWVGITLEEMMAFLGLVVNMSLIHNGDVREYWSTNPFQGTPFFREVFHRDRFLEILYNFQYPELEGSVHRLRKVLYLVQHQSQQYQRFYVPEREVCVDKSITGFQVRTTATQYMPNKHHHRWGLKLRCLCNSRTGYIWDFLCTEALMMLLMSL